VIRVSTFPLTHPNTVETYPSLRYHNLAVKRLVLGIGEKG